MATGHAGIKEMRMAEAEPSAGVKPALGEKKRFCQDFMQN
jgi:hypothetical protein